MRVHRCGPLPNYWTMRYEAKHRYFKYIAKVINNFKNVAKTLAHRHQRHLCYLLANPEKYLVDSVEFGPGKHIEHLYGILSGRAMQVSLYFLGMYLYLAGKGHQSWL